MSHTLTPHQEQARQAVVSRIKGLVTPEPLTYLAGYAGTGKSTILPDILEALGFHPERVSFCAPTGKAAKVMRSKLKAQGYPNFNATTIHSAIYRAKPPPIARLEDDLDAHKTKLSQMIQQVRSDAGAKDEFDVTVDVKLSLNHDITTQRKLVKRLEEELVSLYREDKIDFSLNPDAPIQFSQLIVVDEASMVGRRMTNDLMQFNVPILAIGDPGQLPPVEDEAGLTAGVPDFFLTEIHRQAQDNPIIRLATLARQGKDLPYKDYGDGVIVMKRQDYDPNLTRDNCPQFLVGMNKTRWGINQTLRADLGFVSRGEKVGPRAGEKLIICKNNRDHPDLVNGTECRALSDGDLIAGNSKFELSFEDDDEIEYRGKQVFQGLFEEHFSKKAGKFSADDRIAFRARKNSINIDWAWACTVHKFQGSQADDIVLIDESDVFRKEADRWLYTGVTRAAKKLTVLR